MSLERKKKGFSIAQFVQNIGLINGRGVTSACKYKGIRIDAFFINPNKTESSTILPSFVFRQSSKRELILLLESQIIFLVISNILTSSIIYSSSFYIISNCILFQRKEEIDVDTMH